MGWIKNKKEEPEEMEELKEETKKPVLPSLKKPESTKERVVIVKELPVKQIREYREDDGTIVHLMTIEEALTTLMND